MKPFRERNPVIIGIVGFVVLGALLLAAFRADQLPLVGGGDTYYAEFAEVGGIRTGNEVRVAGVTVGKVKGFELRGDKVRVEMLIDKGAKFGKETGAQIQVRTLLGAMYMSLEPAGPGQLKKDSVIPVERTVSPYDVVQAFSELSVTTDRIDQEQLSEALDTLSSVSEEIPAEFRGAIKGLSSLSRNVAARDEQINDLLVGLDNVTGVLNAKGDELEKLFEDSSVLFEALSDRRESIHDLLVGTQQISRQLTGLVNDNEEQIKPALDNLQGVVTTLRDIEGSLDETLRLIGPFARVFANTLGNGPWFDTFVTSGSNAGDDPANPEAPAEQREPVPLELEDQFRDALPEAN